MKQILKGAIGAGLAGGLLMASGAAPPPAAAVVDGERVAGRDAPWAVSLQTEYRGRWSHACSATVIAPRRLLTARHCVEHESTWQLTAVAGSDEPLRSPGRRSAIARVWAPLLLDWDKPGANVNHSDLAVVETAKELGAPALPLAGPATVSGSGEPVWAYGFGNTSRTSPKAEVPVLRRAAMLLHTRAECAESDFGDVPTAICARRGDGPGAGTLGSGDSGGALVRQGANGPEVVGVNSVVSGGMLGATMAGFASVPALHAFVTAPERGFELPIPRGKAAVRGTARVGRRVTCAVRWSRPVRRVEVVWRLTGGSGRPRSFRAGAKPWKVPAAAEGRRLDCTVTGRLSEFYGSTSEWSGAAEVTR